MQFLAVQLQVVGHLERIADLLDHDDVRPEGKDDHVLVLLAHGAQLKTDLQQLVVERLRGIVVPLLGVFVGADQVDIALGDAGRRLFGHLDGDLVFGHEPDIHHEGIQTPQPLFAEDAGEDRRLLHLFEGAAQIPQEEAPTDPGCPSRMTSMASRAIMGETGVSLVMANSRHMIGTLL